MLERIAKTFITHELIEWDGNVPLKSIGAKILENFHSDIEEARTRASRINKRLKADENISADDLNWFNDNNVWALHGVPYTDKDFIIDIKNHYESIFYNNGIVDFKQLPIKVVQSIEWIPVLLLAGYTNIEFHVMVDNPSTITAIVEDLGLLGVKTVVITNINELENKMKKMQGIMGNPPYEFANSKNDDEKLWHEFVERNIIAMQQNAVLAFIVPVSMMTGPGPEKKFRPLFEEHGVLDVHCAKIHKKKMFEAAVDTCHFIVSKSNKLNNLDKLFIGSTVFGPLNQSILEKVLCFTDSHPCFKISDGGFVTTNGNKSLINVSQYLTDKPTDSPFQIMYKGNNEPVYIETPGTLCSVGKWKVIVPRSRAVNSKTMFVLAPEFGCDKLHGFIEFDSKEEAELALSFFNTKLVQYCANTYKMSHGKYASGYKQLFNQTNCLRNPGLKQWTDEEAFEFFQITEQEKSEILKQFEKKPRNKNVK